MRTRRTRHFQYKYVVLALVGVLILSVCFFFLPRLVVWHHVDTAKQTPFPVSVDPVNKVITKNPEAETFFKQPTPPEAAVIDAKNVMAALGEAIANTQLYELVAAATPAVPHIVTIYPGLRKEEVATLFAKKLAWDANTKNLFLDLPPVTNTTLNEGTISPGEYAVSSGDSILALQTQITDKFNDDILSRYTPAVQKIVPLIEGLTIASIIERETSDPDDMRIVSGVIWNRLFAGMKLQMDSTVQYSKATGKGSWWPQLTTKDKFIDSPYNTYQHAGLPPDPISEPSTAAVFAALNPVKTSCLYYFNDDAGTLHCSDTYEQHVALLKKIYGQGK